MKFKKNFDEYIKRASNLLQYDDDINLTYCALELRRAIELIVWTQFIDAFRQHLLNAGMYTFDYPFKLQSKSILKMYELLKKHISNYFEDGKQRATYIHWSTTYSDNAQPKEIGKECYIPPELPTSDYRYLSNILHYEKEIVPKDFRPNKKRLTSMYEKLKFVQVNYVNIRYLRVDKDIDEIVDNIKKTFNLSDDEFRSFPRKLSN